MLMSKVRRERFCHKAIVKTLALWLFVEKPNGLGYKMSSDDNRMADRIPKGTLAWVCVAVIPILESTNLCRLNGA